MGKPTVLFVHGLWHQPLHYRKCRDVFEAAGYPTACPYHLSCTGVLPPIGLKEDVEGIRKELDQLVEKDGKDVIVVAHSYGGIVSTESVEEKYAKKTRSAKGLPGGVLHIVYMCAFLLKVGLTLEDGLGDAGFPPWITIDERDMCYPTNTNQVFFDDLPAEEAQTYTNAIKACPQKTQTTALSHGAYLYHPVTYILCTKDKALPIQAQEMMVQNVLKDQDIPVRVESLPASHSPYLSMPERVLEMIQRLPV